MNLDQLKSAAPDLRSRPTRVVVGALVVLVIGAAVLWYVRAADDLPDDAAFQVGDEVVTEAELERRVGVLESLYGIKPPAGSSAESEDFRRSAAQSIALSKIMDRAADERDIVIADKAASDVLGKIIRTEFPELGRSGYVKTLGNSGVTEDDVIAEIKRQMAIQQLFDEVTEGVSVTDEEVRSAFRERRADLATPEARRISNIVVPNRRQAAAVVRQLRSGAGFPEMVRQYSLDASTRAKGGDLGLVNQEQLERAFGKAAFAARPGETFGPVKSSHGWNVGVVRSVVAGKPATFRKVAADLRKRLQTEEALSQWREFLQEKLNEADVVYADAYRPEDPDQLPEAGAVESPALPGSAQ